MSSGRRHGDWRPPAALAAAAVIAAGALCVWLVTRPSRRSRTPRVVATSTTTANPTTTTALPARPGPASQQFGANVNLLFNDGDLSPAVIGAQLTALHATGAALARSDALWEASEPIPPTADARPFDWSFDDRIATELAAHGLRWLPILDYSVSWAQSEPGVDHSPPRSDADYAAYAGAFAARYGTGGSFWREHPSLPALPVTTIEIWNEPDNPQFWQPTPDAAAYADLYVAARNAIDAVDSTARVIVGGLTRPTSFLPAMLRARPQLRGHLDGVAIHPYGTPAVLRDRIVAARRTLDSLGLATVPLYVTEFGWTTSPPGADAYASAADRPADISAALSTLGSLNCDVAVAIIYTWYSNEADGAAGQGRYGIDAADARPTPDTTAFARGLRGIAAAGPPRRACER